MDVLSIDFGTSSTVGVLSAFGRGPRVIEVDGSVTMSSAVYANEDGSLVVGQDAERRARLDPSRFEANPKRRIDDGTLLLGDAVVPVVDAFAAVLRRIGEEAQRQLSAPLGEVRIAHPAGWGVNRQGVLRQAAMQAGFGTIQLIPEPVAAAAHYASLADHPSRLSRPLAVYDLGAGTFDCAVVGFTDRGFAVLAEDGLADLGSIDIDQALLVHVGREVSHADPAQWQRLLRPQTVSDRRIRRSLLQDVRDAKESLSRHPQTEVPMPEPFSDVLLTRLELEALVRPSLLRSAELLAATIQRAGLTPGQLSGIYLVGGPSRMPLLAGLLGNQLGVLPTTQDQPETAVAFGLHHVPVGGDVAQLTVPAFAPVARPVTPPRPRQWQAQPPPPVSPPPLLPVKPQSLRSANKPALIGAAAVVLVAALIAVVLVVNNSGSKSSATNAASGSGPAPVLADKTSCEQVGTKDEQGFTGCLRQLAAPVANQATCQGAAASAKTLGAKAGVTCEFTVEKAGLSKAVTYYQGITSDALADGVRVQMGGKPVEGTWTGGGMSGKYLAGVGSAAGIVLFGVDDRPICGMFVSVDLGGPKQKPADLVKFFTERLKPA